ncbi:MAG: DNA-binding protein [Oscillospiraceae bacterium]|nr:DNA-binding protein [Oscillospiraceae bacterium]
MISYLGKHTGRVLVIALERGELLLESIEQQCREAGFANATVETAIGTLQKTVFHRVLTLDRKSTNEFVTVETPVELSNIDGIIAEGQAHLHFSASDPDKTYIAHLEYGCEVLYLAEIVLAELEPMPLGRRKNELGQNLMTRLDEEK